MLVNPNSLTLTAINASYSPKFHMKSGTVAGAYFSN